MRGFETGIELHFSCVGKRGQGNSDNKIIEEFLAEAAA